MKTQTIQQILVRTSMLAVALACSGCFEGTLPQDDSCPSTCSASSQIIGCDDRTPRPDTADSMADEPWNFIGKLHGIGCTGTLIAPKYVLTAAHCVDSLNDTSMVGFALGQEVENVAGRPYGTYGAKRVFIPSPFMVTNNEEDRAFDYAIVELFEPIAGATPAIWGYDPWDVIRHKGVFTAGYPGTQPDGGFLGRPWITGGSFHSAQPFELLDSGESGLLYTDLDGTGGQSGSPVYTFLLPAEHDGDGTIRKVTGVLIGSPVSACETGQHWVARLTPGAVDHIDNAMNAVSDNFWFVVDLAASPTVGVGQAWP